MSIMVRGMEMPISCEECNLESFCSLWVDARRQFGDGKRTSVRHPDCPLIEVPPHGKLIDADDLIRRCKQHINKYENSIAPQAQYYRDRDKDFIRSLEIAPTILEEEEGE